MLLHTSIYLFSLSQTQASVELLKVGHVHSAECKTSYAVFVFENTVDKCISSVVASISIR
jgi:hypothetical protein